MRVVLPNERAYDRAGTGHHSLFSQEHCCVCGKAIRLGHAEWLLLCRAADSSCEYAISQPEAATEEEIKNNGIWVQPIGADCLRKNPRLRVALVGEGLMLNRDPGDADALPPQAQGETIQSEAEPAQWLTWGVAEIAVRNPNVASYMNHWEGRALKAEAEIATLRQQVREAFRAGYAARPIGLGHERWFFDIDDTWGDEEPAAWHAYRALHWRPRMSETRVPRTTPKETT